MQAELSNSSTSSPGKLKTRRSSWQVRIWFNARWQAIDAAQASVHLQTYIFRMDGIGQRFTAAFEAAVKRKVEVRLLYDSIGCRQLGKKDFRALEQAGVRVAEFHPTNPLKRRFQINFRNHRKNLIVDGVLGFTGGHNIGDEYLGVNAPRNRWRDTHIRIDTECACVRTAETYFLLHRRHTVNRSFQLFRT